MIHFLVIITAVFYIYIIISTISVLLLENRNPVKSFSWLLVLVFIPVVGLVLYILLGQNYRKRKIISRKSIQRITERPVASFDIDKLSSEHMDQHFIKLSSMLKKNSEAEGYAYIKYGLCGVYRHIRHVKHRRLL